jgi:hypothetical protein
MPGTMIVLARCSVESLHGTSRAQMFGPDFSAHAADTHIVEGLSIGIAHPSEDIARNGEVG